MISLSSIIRRPPPGPLARPLGLALQGGGIHGAFTWGVLDRLLEDPDFRPSAMAGASAGALNAVVMAAGLARGGTEEARHALAELWEGVADMPFVKMMGTPWGPLHFDLLSRLVSPYQFNPLNINPLRDLLVRLVDFEALRRTPPMALFLSATNMRTGTARIFRETEVTPEVLLASSCLPYLHHTVEIDGEAYWDGGFSANPPLLPLVLETQCRSVLLVRLTPEENPEPPVTAQDIFSRMKQMMFTTPLLRDLDELERLRTRLPRLCWPDGEDDRLKRLRLDSITIPADQMAGRSSETGKDDTIARLHAQGREAAEELLTKKAAPPAEP